MLIQILIIRTNSEWKKYIFGLQKKSLYYSFQISWPIRFSFDFRLFLIPNLDTVKLVEAIKFITPSTLHRSPYGLKLCNCHILLVISFLFGLLIRTFSIDIHFGHTHLLFYYFRMRRSSRHSSSSWKTNTRQLYWIH